VVGDALNVLRTLPSASVDTAITSPPYYLLRNYGASGQIGAEESVVGWVNQIVAVCSELARVIKPSGSLWLNLGDSYSRHERYGAGPKSLLLGPERVLLALADQGWVVRNKIVWAKPNPTPASVVDRLTCTWEPVYLLTRSPHYYFDLDAIRAPHCSQPKPQGTTRPGKYSTDRAKWAGPLAGSNDGLVRARAEGRPGHPLGKNPGDVWSVATTGYRGAHHAVFPPALIERPIRATCPERVCRQCGEPWRRVRARKQLGELRAGCSCRRGWRTGIVLDPFMGAGTVGLVAQRLGRDWLGIELNPEFRHLAMQRIDTDRVDRPRGSPGV
jgi:DNA modification methylase